MRYALLSDIHSNLEAFEAVLKVLAKERIDGYLSLGDVIGYGADPHACLALLRSIGPAVLIAGNHEWAALGLIDTGYFNPEAKEAVVWTRNALGREDLDFLKSFKLVHETEKFVLVHGTLESPENFNYILSKYDAYDNMRFMNVPLCFVGHSHVPGIFYSCGDGAEYSAGPGIKINHSVKYVINAGSIGQPRDDDPRASFAIYDDEKNTLEIKRVAYDIKTAQSKIMTAGLPERLAARLSRGM